MNVSSTATGRVHDEETYYFTLGNASPPCPPDDQSNEITILTFLFFCVLKLYKTKKKRNG